MSIEGGTSPLDPEDQARAALYGLIAQLFYAPPDQNVLAQILNARAFEGDEGALARRWRELTERCRTALPVTLENEHTDLFVGTGKSEVTPYLTHYAAERTLDNPLVQLRKQLAEWGMSRREHATEPEDHVAGVCESMRLAIASQHRTVVEQKSFFELFVYKGAIAFFAAVVASPKSDFYRCVAGFDVEFVELERKAFDMA